MQCEQVRYEQVLSTIKCIDGKLVTPFSTASHERLLETEVFSYESSALDGLALLKEAQFPFSFAAIDLTLPLAQKPVAPNNSQHNSLQIFERRAEAPSE
jgi:hypothetical protein